MPAGKHPALHLPVEVVDLQSLVDQGVAAVGTDEGGHKIVHKLRVRMGRDIPVGELVIDRMKGLLRKMVQRRPIIG